MGVTVSEIITLEALVGSTTTLETITVCTCSEVDDGTKLKEPVEGSITLLVGFTKGIEDDCKTVGTKEDVMASKTLLVEVTSEDMLCS